jgi:hypothetical protein
MLTFGLDFFKQPEEFPGPDRAYVFIDTLMVGVVKQGKGRVPKRYVTPECVTYRELEINVDKIIKDLERVKKIAARKFGVAATKRRPTGR